MTVVRDGEEEPLGDELETPDSQAIGRIASRVELTSVNLVDAYFRAPALDDGPVEPDLLGLDVETAVELDMLVCSVGFRTVFQDIEPGSDDEPFVFQARFRLTYALRGDDPPESDDVAQFGRWNALFNAWPYWREYVQSMSSRSHMNRVNVGVMGMPVSQPREVFPPGR